MRPRVCKPAVNLASTYLQTEMNEDPVNFRGDLWTAYRVPQTLLVFLTGIIATN
jgi:hypothetical protein